MRRPSLVSQPGTMRSISEQLPDPARLKVFIVGISGAVGGLLAKSLLERGDQVAGLVRRDEQRDALADLGARAYVAELAGLSADSLAALLAGSDVLVYTAGSNGGSREVTAAIDGEGVLAALEAARLAGVDRFVLVSVLPEAGRAHDLGADVEFYFAVKKLIDVTVTTSDLDWLIVRPSLLVDRDGIGTISLGPAQPDDEISREDVAATLAELLHEPRVRRKILELTQGTTPIVLAVLANVP